MASAVVANNGSFTSPLADAKFAQFVGQSHINGLITQISELSPWTVLLTIFLCLVAYDQCKKPLLVYSPPLTFLTGSYLWQKGSIEGPSWKAPFTGPFLQSVRPNFEEYKGKWASGPLSCVSVFHK
jgi:C-22 sterol desaturase